MTGDLAVMYWEINVRENNDDQGHKSAGSGETEKRPTAERLRSQGCVLPTLQLPWPCASKPVPARPVTAEDKDLSETALWLFRKVELGWYHEHIRPFGMNVLFYICPIDSALAAAVGRALSGIRSRTLRNKGG
ncbi:MAG TPA: hypothetical protein DCK78_17750 [Paenibacillus lactis]|nr:hypothetical protein [Paenibacillus lactis]